MAKVTRPLTGELLRNLPEILMAPPEGPEVRDGLSLLGQRNEVTKLKGNSYAFGPTFRQDCSRCYRRMHAYKGSGRSSEAALRDLLTAGRSTTYKHSFSICRPTTFGDRT